MAITLRKLLCLLVIISSFNAIANISDDYEKIAQNVLKFDFWNNEKVYCAPHQKIAKTGNPNGDYLVNVASADVVVVFVHGFRPHNIGGEQSLREMVDTWKYHIDLLDELDQSISYCVVTWDTEYGFDDPKKTLVNLMHILKSALSDKRLGTNTKTLNYVGHSAGGNYIKYSAVLEKQVSAVYAKRSYEVSPNIAKNYRWLDGKPETKLLGLVTTIVTLATPHLGSELADSSSYTSLFAQYYLPLLGEQVANVGQHYVNKAQSRGAQQLRSIHSGNSALYELNRIFVDSFPKSNTWAIAGTADTTVSVESANPYFARNYSLGFEHDTFLQPYRNKSYMDFLKSIYTNSIGKKDDE